MSKRQSIDLPTVSSTDEFQQLTGWSKNRQAKARMRGDCPAFFNDGGVKYVNAREWWSARIAARLQKHTRDKPRSATASGVPAPEAAGIEGGCTPDPLEALGRRHRTRTA